MLILGIESSCDETAAAIVDGRGERVRVLANVVSSQVEIHKKYGGVVPEIAAREHVLHILPVIHETLNQAGINKKNIAKKITAISMTSGPGLITSLIVGTETAKTLAYSWNKPLVPLNHIESHIYGNFIDRSKIKLPAIILTVSGGHTIIVLMTAHGDFKIVGETRDDAAGEAFDKAAQLMNLGYPGGPIISARAQKYLTDSKIHNTCLAGRQAKSKIVLPRPMIEKPGYEFSFSGLKTALLYQLQKDKDWQNRVDEYCYEFERAVVEVLVHKTIKAAQKFGVSTVMLAGGVAANSTLREVLNEKVKTKLAKASLLIPDLKYTTDNAAMVATNGYFRFKNGFSTSYQQVKADPNLTFGS
jgi:N6-L-threonylcarbamoyladenine synthase